MKSTLGKFQLREKVIFIGKGMPLLEGEIIKSSATHPIPEFKNNKNNPSFCEEKIILLTKETNRNYSKKFGWTYSTAHDIKHELKHSGIVHHGFVASIPVILFEHSGVIVVPSGTILNPHPGSKHNDFDSISILVSYSFELDDWYNKSFNKYTMICNESDDMYSEKFFDNIAEEDLVSKDEFENLHMSKRPSLYD